MNLPRDSGPSRREFLRHAALAAGLTSVSTTLWGTEAAATPSQLPPVESPATGYLSLGPEEAAFVEAMINVLCPADELTPSGVDCGLAVFIDRQLAGAFGRGERLYLRGPWRPGLPQDGYQLPMAPEQFFKTGLAAADAACREQHGRSFADLETTVADSFLSALAEGKIAHSRMALAEWFNDLVYPLFIQACFADPIYGGNQDKVFWKMIGYPGLPAVNGLNMVKYRGKPFPGARHPKSIQDFS
ncbi:MAG: gluconate 2-dehydrogenase subunit 3 family protein [Lacunisphaera sp.]|nr:gluconate 2-dehydrogenase subunit 3 family protein [Lacunisphaera sp.]